MRLRTTTWIAALVLSAGIASDALAQARQYYPMTPCRIVDTRSGFGGVLTGDTYRNFTVRGNGLGIGGGHTCNVPTAAKALVMQVVAVAPTGAGLFVVTDLAANVTASAVSHLNWEAGTANLANHAIVPMTTSNQVKVYAGFHPANSSHLILDVMGYFQ